jgi:hypothetical protein
MPAAGRGYSEPLMRRPAEYSLEERILRADSHGGPRWVLRLFQRTQVNAASPERRHLEPATSWSSKELAIIRPRLAGSILLKFIRGSFQVPYPFKPKFKASPCTKETVMPKIVRPVVSALSVACLAISLAALATGNALAQAKQGAAKQSAPAPAVPPPQQEEAPIKQIALTDKQVENMLAVTQEMDTLTATAPEDAKPDSTVTGRLERIARKNGFASFDEYTNVFDNVRLVLAGIDPLTKKYVGPEAAIKSQLARIQADKKMSAKEKQEALAEMDEALKSPPPPAIENKGNINVVIKYYDKLAEFGSGKQD